MPLEVRQIGLRLQVADPETAAPPKTGDPAAPAGQAALDPAERASIVDECTRAVLAALKAQGER